ncbi:sugar ABC transporter permease [Alsobacter sp. SYSU M60028]|uniref:Sugar ABC transporter permease n=1 Tax=Alsobacter ponti TaxID=2962936 RepID=A0ABT1L9X9_9HYPH|nr:sugar ABC transporter permease [Alsobacter ponti]MCP8938269.1 sugar ABC transporter permease [Alsobacter ponti]
MSANLEWPLRRRVWVTFLIVPPLAFMTAFVVVPILSAFVYAFYDWQGLKRADFVGLRNFLDVLGREPWAATTWRAFGHNVIVFVTLMILQNGFGFLLAYALSRQLPGHRFHRVAVFLPVILSSVIVALVWKQFLHPVFGLLNKTLGLLGFGAVTTPWLGLSETALWALILVNAWHWVGFPTLVFLAGIQRIPPDIIEASRIDGVTEWQLVSRIVWPLVAPSATVVFILLFIGAFNWFELPYLMSGLEGSPYGSTDVLGLFFYRTAFGNQSSGAQDFGHGSALAVLMFVFIAAVSAVWTVRLRRREIELS